MTFEEILDQAMAMLQRRGRLTYGTLKRQFQLDDDALEDLTHELIEGQRLAVDEGGNVLVWTGDTVLSAAPATALAPVQTQTLLTYTPPHLTDKIRAARAALEGERKQVTVLFADLKDSTELIRGLDPEVAQQLLDPTLQYMIDAVHRFEGTVNHVLGDGIMALFGAPIAHEDHALRACYAALAMQTAMQPYAVEVRRSRGLELRMRVGLNSGEVVVRAIGNDLHMDYSAVGETTHLAARMEQLATPGSIWLTASTLGLVEGLVRVNDLGPIPIKGLIDPIGVFELTGVTPLRRRLQAATARGLTRFVGRQHELNALRQILAQTQAGYGQVVALVGEAGVGKSRLAYECVHTHPMPGWLALESASASYGKAIPYFTVLDLLRRYCRVEDQDEIRSVRAKVTDKVLALDEALRETLPALLSLLEVLPEDSPFRSLDPPQRRQRTIQALKRVLLRESQMQPLLLVFEDLHWVDAETQALLDSLVESLPTARLLLFVNYRPEYQHGWGGKTYYTQLHLEPLPPANADELLQALLGDDPNLVPLKQLLIARTEGNPFFLEESVRTLVETGVLVGEPGGYRLAQELLTIQVPATVQAVLAARMDRLPAEDKRLLQTAAVVGTAVPLPLLQAIADMPEAVLHRSLAHLQTAEFLYETRLFPEPEYTFKHALTHEVAYSSLLLERRRVLHARLVDTIETLAPERTAEVTSEVKSLPAGRQDPDQIERLAHHALRGEVWDKAVTYCRQTGIRAFDHAAFREAVDAFEQTLQALTHLPECGDTQGLILEIHFALARALLQLGEYGRSFALLSEAEVLARRLDDRTRLGLVLAQMAVVLRVTGTLDGAIAAGQQALDLAAELGESALQAEASQRLGEAYYASGDFSRAVDLLRRNVGTADREFGTPGPALQLRGQAWLVRTLGALGAFAEGRRHAEEALRLAMIEGQGVIPIVVYACLGYLYLAQGDLEQAVRMFDQGLTLCRASGSRDWLRPIVAGLGYAYALQGNLAEGHALLEEGISESIRTGGLQGIAYRVAWLSDVCRLMGHDEKAWQHAHQALDLARQQKERANEALALYQLGVVYTHAAPPDAAQAEAHYQQALILAEALGMRPLVAHCHHGLGRLYHQLGHDAQARTTLSVAIDLYRAMNMIFWLPLAEALLIQVEK
jgi:predicted ATPase/class 3 adenylate cyclase